MLFGEIMKSKIDSDLIEGFIMAIMIAISGHYFIVATLSVLLLNIIAVTFLGGD